MPKRVDRSAGRKNRHKMEEARKPEPRTTAPGGAGEDEDRHHGRSPRIGTAQRRVNRSSQQRPRNQYENTDFKQGYHEFVAVEARMPVLQFSETEHCPFRV